MENSIDRPMGWRYCIGPVVPFKSGELGDSKAQAVKVVEEASELLYAVSHGTYEEAVEEIGDVLQATVNLSEVMGIDLKDAIAQANERNEARGRF